MMREKIKYVCWTILFAIIAFCVIIPVLPPPSNLSRIPQTRTEIKLCYSMIAKIEADKSNSIQNIITAQKTTGNLNEDIALLINAERERLDPSESRWNRYIANGEITDAWGRPLQIKLRKDLANTNYDDLKGKVGTSIIIWSLGPNGKDDYGTGDDVISEIVK